MSRIAPPCLLVERSRAPRGPPPDDSLKPRRLSEGANPFLDADAVFLPKSSLIVDFVRHDSAEEVRAQKTTLPFCTVEFDFGLKPLVLRGPPARDSPEQPPGTPRRTGGRYAFLAIGRPGSNCASSDGHLG
jgi:hypothetical protein